MTTLVVLAAFALLASVLLRGFWREVSGPKKQPRRSAKAEGARLC